MRLRTYQPEDYPLLEGAARELGAECTLGHRAFVRWYFEDTPWCRLYLALREDGSLAGTLGCQDMRFVSGGEELRFSYGSNFYAFDAGAGGLLFLQWMKTCRRAVVYGGSAHTHRILAAQRWTYFEGIEALHLNRRYGVEKDEALPRRLAKRLLNRRPAVPLSFRLRALPRALRAEVCVVEVPEMKRELLPTDVQGFGFRYAPHLDELRWRYDPGLAFVRYRIFGIERRGRSAGYVVLNENDQIVRVAHAEGVDPETLALGMLRALEACEAQYGAARDMMISCSHTLMRRVFGQVGFRPTRYRRPFALGAMGRPLGVDAPVGTWLVSFDWGDNGLRTPFLDGRSPSSSSMGRTT